MIAHCPECGEIIEIHPAKKSSHVCRKRPVTSDSTRKYEPGTVPHNPALPAERRLAQMLVALTGRVDNREFLVDLLTVVPEYAALWRATMVASGEMASDFARSTFREEECGGAFDGFRVISDADPGL